MTGLPAPPQRRRRPRRVRRSLASRRPGRRLPEGVDDMTLRTLPICTAVIVAITTLLTVLQYRQPEIRLALWRDPEQLRAGQWWRLLTALFVQSRHLDVHRP